nr:hypothetical protein [Tanacetum cinerariifolium]
REVKYIEKIRTLEMYRASNLKSIKALDKELEEVKLEKDGLDGKLAGLLKASKNLDHLIQSQRPSPTIASTSAEGQNKDSSTFEDIASPNPPKPFVKFVKPKDSQPESKSKEQETPEIQIRNLRETTRSQNHTYKRPPLRSYGQRPHGGSMRPSHRSASHRPHGPSMNPRRPSMNGIIPLLVENFPLVEEIFPLSLGNFPLLAENLPLVAQKITLLIWEGREKL